MRSPRKYATSYELSSSYRLRNERDLFDRRIRKFVRGSQYIPVFFMKSNCYFYREIIITYLFRRNSKEYSPIAFQHIFTLLRIKTRTNVLVSECFWQDYSILRNEKRADCKRKRNKGLQLDSTERWTDFKKLNNYFREILYIYIIQNFPTRDVCLLVVTLTWQVQILVSVYVLRRRERERERGLRALLIAANNKMFNIDRSQNKLNRYLIANCSGYL